MVIAGFTVPFLLLILSLINVSLAQKDGLVLTHEHSCRSKEALTRVLLMEDIIGAPSNPIKILKSIINREKGSYFQVGANTMNPKTNHEDEDDPLLSILDAIPSWQKFFVEPIPTLAKKAEVNVKRFPLSTVINAALSVDSNNADTVTFQPMYCPSNYDIAEEGGAQNIPIYFGMICSFSKAHVLKHTKAQNEADFKIINVSTMSYQYMMKQFNIEDVKILIIDVEGFDFEALKLFPFHVHKPNFIAWEFGHLSPTDKVAAETFARHHCYAVWKSGINMYGFLTH